jgi:hypothetical protein
MAGAKKPEYLQFFLTARQFESRDFAGPLMAIVHPAVPQLRRQAVAKYFRCGRKTVSVVVVIDGGLPDLCGPEVGIAC